MNKKLFLTFAFAGILFSNTFCVDEKDAAAVAWFWTLFERKELNKPFSGVIDSQCILPHLAPQVLAGDMQANIVYQECVRTTGSKKVCDAYRKAAIYFHETLRPIMEECTKNKSPRDKILKQDRETTKGEETDFPSGIIRV